MYSLLILIPFLLLIVLNLPFAPAARRAALAAGMVLSMVQIWLAASPAYDLLSGSSGFLSIFNFDLSADQLTRLMLLCIGIIVLVTFLVACAVVTNEEHRFNFVNIALIALIGMNGIVIVRDIFSLYVFLEITAVASFILIAFDKDPLALEGAFKYIILSAVATILMLSSVAILLLISGSSDFAAINSALKISSNSSFIMLAVALFSCGLFIKAGLMPFHGWVPDAYASASAPVSVLLAGIVTKTVGVYALIRVVTAVFGFGHSIGHVLLLVGTVSIVVAALAALGQKDFKRMLAYSSISQVGYIIVGLGCGTPLGIAGAMFHLFNHAIFKSLLFVNAAAVESRTGTRDMEKMSGLAARMPVTGTTSVIGVLSAAGIPPLAGFWSKLIIVIALWTSGYHAVAGIAVLASVLTLAYFLSMQRNVFFGKIKQDFEHIKEAGFYLTFPAVLLAAIIIAVGVFFPFMLNTFILPIKSVLGG